MTTDPGGLLRYLCLPRESGSLYKENMNKTTYAIQNHKYEIEKESSTLSTFFFIGYHELP